MVRLSDIYKKKKKEEIAVQKNQEPIAIPKKEEEPQKSTAFSSITRTSRHKLSEDGQPRGPEKTGAPEAKGSSLEINLKDKVKADTYKGRFEDAEYKNAEKLYFDMLETVKNFYQSVGHRNKYFDHKIYEQVQQLIDVLIKGEDKILSFTGKITVPNYLYSHVINVCLLSIRLGIAVGYDKESCMELGLSALFHDLGLIRKTALMNKMEKLTDSELEEIKSHSEEGRRIIYGLNFISDELKRLIAGVVYQCHERQGGSGYPAGIKGEQLHNYAQIVGLVDTYEALSHHRSYRGRFLPHDVCRWLIEGREASDEFNLQLIKKFIETIGLYPIGSFVRLSSGEIAEVIKVNAQYPLKPQIQIIISIDEEKVDPPKKVNLLNNLVLQIIGPVDETKLHVRDKKFALHLLSRNWIVLK